MAGTITHKWDGTVLTVTSDSGTSSADLKGAKGDDGARGAVGACPTLSVNGKIGEVVLNADDVGAISKTGGTMTGGLMIQNNNSAGFVQIHEDGEGGTIVIGSKDGSYKYEIDANYNNRIRIHNAPSHPNGFRAIEWNAGSGALVVDELILTSKPLAITGGGTGAITASGARTNIGAASEAEVKEQRYYTAKGKIFGNLANGTSEGYGVANVFIYPNKLVRVDFSLKITTSGTVSGSVYSNGIKPSLLHELNNDIPSNIEPISGGVVNYYKSDGTANLELIGYGGTSLRYITNNNGVWAFARMYTPEGDVGNWGDNCFLEGHWLTGTLYGKLV